MSACSQRWQMRIDAALGDRVALIAEDVHLFDSASQDVIARLARRAADRAWLVVLVHRGGLDLGLESARRRESIDLTALDADDARRLAEVATRIAGTTDHVADARQIERLADRAGGHPLYLLELLSAGLDSEHDEALPESIESLVTTRIDKLPAQDRVLLREASVAGLVIDTTLIAESFDRPDLVAPDRWHALGDFLEHRGGDRFRFRHDLYRAVAYEGLAYRRRRHVHRSLGHTLERRHEGDLARVAPLLSTHFDRGRDDDRAWTYSVLAARHVPGRVRQRRGGDAVPARARSRRIRRARRAGGGRPRRRGAGRRVRAEREVLVGGRGVSAQPSRQPCEHLAEARMLRKIGSVREREGRLSQALRWYSRAQRRIIDVPVGPDRSHEEAETALSRAGTLNRQGRNR